MRPLIIAKDRGDLALIQAVTMVTVIGLALGNLLAELLCPALNPRIRLQ